MDNSHALTVARGKDGNRLRRECNFGQQNDDSSPVVEQLINECEHHAGLAATRNTVEQCRTRLAGID